ncbi:Na/Pi cotransporter family protein [Lachnospiraceae bacterium OttesenSCG-928-D06]|nr:Na/Pi cotransporter family protein [Lachnospiraceae bacterium OttesenSCG-928-D06]
MNITSIVTFLSGLAFFLFGMMMMGDGIKKMAGNQMQIILGKLASTRFRGILLGTFVTAIIQSSSATSVMAVSFVSSGIMTLGQAISIVMGANIGTTATGWILTLAGMDGNSALGSILSTTFIFGIVAVIGIVLYMFGKGQTGKNTGVILVSLSVLMSGMKAMSSAMEPLQSSDFFMGMMTVANPVLCLIVGILATALIQSCSAAIGILQALSMTGIIPFSVAIPMVVGMSIGACVPVLISAVTASKDGKRTALSYLYFNIFGGVVFMFFYAIASFTQVGNSFFSATADTVSIAVINTIFKVFSVVMLYPFISPLERLVRMSIKDDDVKDDALFDEMLLNYPAQALERSNEIMIEMVQIASQNIKSAIGLFSEFDGKEYEELMLREKKQDDFEDRLGGFLVKLFANELTLEETQQSGKYLRCVTDLERISDYAETLAILAKELKESGKEFSEQAKNELSVPMNAVLEIMEITLNALIADDVSEAYRVKPLDMVIQELAEKLKQSHIRRLQNGECQPEISFLFNDCINSLERVAGHCSNVAISIIKIHDKRATEAHLYLHKIQDKENSVFCEYLENYGMKYNL